MRSTMSLLIQLTLMNARTSSQLIVKKPPSRSITALPLLDMTLRLCLMDMLDMDMASVLLMLKLLLDTPLDLSVMTRRTDSAIRSQSKMNARFPVPFVKTLLTQPTLRSVRKHSPPSATLLTPKFTIALLLLVMTLRLLPILMVDMVDMDTRSVKLMLSQKQRPKLNQDMDTPAVPNAMPRRTDSVTKSLSRTLTRFPEKSVTTLDIPSRISPMVTVMDMDAKRVANL